MAKPCRNESGFTLTEMLIALGILVFGLTALAGSMMSSVSQRRGTEMQFRAVNMVDFIVHDLRENHFQTHKEADKLPISEGDTVPGFPGMKYRVRFKEDPENRKVVLARIQISWLDQGERVAEEFQRILIREQPYSHRISNLKEQR